MNKILDIISYALWPISFLWGFLYRIRRYAYNYGVFKSNRFDVPIISVGNLSFGGTGKTPYTLWLAEYLKSKKHSPLILMRGYKGKAEKKFRALDKNNFTEIDVQEVGDEASLLMNRLQDVPIIVGKKRSENLKHFFPKYRPNVVLLDDGHQHLKLARDLNIVLFDSLMATSKYKTAPLGYLREGLSALEDADAILFSRADQVSRKKLDELKALINPYLHSSTVYGEFRYIPTGFCNYKFQRAFALEKLKNKNIYALSGIASPDSFYNLLESLGMVITQKHSFPDHHKYIKEDLSPLLEAANNNDTYIITTEKDMVKLKELVDSERLLYLEIQLEFLNGQSEIENLIDTIF